MKLTDTALHRFLAQKAPSYATRLEDLRRLVTEWLNRVPETFPHYTSHTAAHSDEIVAQVSKLIFEDGDPDRPVVRLAPLEAYIVGAAAYLHDAGMVASDQDKAAILGSAEWNSWISDGGGKARWSELTRFRASRPASDAMHHFLADVQTRFLLAEFIRRTHHLRSGDFVRLNEDLCGQFAFGDPALLRAIADVCAAHGLSAPALRDRERFPERTDIRGETVNLLFAALVLRLGDLLDLSSDRACPLLLNRACTLPENSLAHWTQYQRISHRLTATDRIEIRAECQNQHEHQLLQDWCLWLVNEIEAASTLIGHCTRHKEWRLPHATLDTTGATIQIRPAPGARYRPVRWRFKLDEEVIVERLVGDLYTGPLTFVRELLQNACDASRVRLYAALEEAGEALPDLPSHAPEDWLERFPVRVALTEASVRNNLSGEDDRRTLLSVEDSGSGMDEDIITNYLLQIGRSYYTSPQFVRSARFAPTSRFGVGFLSTFAAGDLVTVETKRAEGPGGGLRLALGGPRNYVLVEDGTRSTPGTRITVRLTTAVTGEALVEAVRSWCHFVEFPIEVTAPDGTETIRRESPEAMAFDEPDLTRPGTRLLLRAFPVERPGVDGTLYVLARRAADGNEDWTDIDWFKKYVSRTAEAAHLQLPPSIRAFHGISTRDRWSALGGSYPLERLDFRRPIDVPSMGRTGLRGDGGASEPSVRDRWAELVDAHLSQARQAHGPNAWKYRQRMARTFSFLKSYWLSAPNTVRVWNGGEARYLSLVELASLHTFTIVWEPHNSYSPDYERLRGTRDDLGSAFPAAFTTITVYELVWLAHDFLDPLFRDRSIATIQRIGANRLRVDWSKDGRARERFLDSGTYVNRCFVADCGDLLPIGRKLFRLNSSAAELIVLNERSAFVQWLLRARDACEQASHGLSPHHWTELEQAVSQYYYRDGISRLAGYVDSWRRLEGLPDDLQPPSAPITDRDFRLAPAT